MEGELWERSPAMALVLCASTPSGDQNIVDLRDRIVSQMAFRNQPKTGLLPSPWIRHVSGDFHEYPSSRIYIGFGYTDCQLRPSQWASPYYFLSHSIEEAYDLFSEYLRARADLRDWLFPLRGAELICDRDRGCHCHGNLLVEAFQETFCPADASDDEDTLDAMSAACVLEGFDDDNDDDDGVAPAPKFNPDIEAINETVRSGAAKLHEERPSW